MKKILIFSDTHGCTDPCIQIIEQEKPHAIIHAGDCTRDAEDISYIFPDIPVHFVKGNNDFFTTAPEHMTVIIDGVRIYVTHGHEHRVKYDSDYRTLISDASKSNPDLIVFGHTHIPCTDYKSVTVLNPGSIRFSGTYAVVETENGKFTTRIVEI